MRPRRFHTRTAAGAVGFCGILLLSSCSGADAGNDIDAVPEAERYGGTAVVGIAADVKTLDPLYFQDGLAIWINKYQIFTPLVRYDSLLQVQPLLAERWDTARVHSDSIDLTLHLRTDVKWHDGVPTTAGDVRFAFERMMDPNTAFPVGFFLRGYSPRAEVLNDSTIRFRLQPFPEYLEIWSLVGGLPEHLLGAVPPEQMRQHAYGQRPVGNGPFRLAGRVPGQSWTLEANPDRPEALGGRPYLDRIVYRNLPDRTARLTELATGTMDLDFDFSSAQARQAEDEFGLRLVPFQTPTYTFIAWNTKRPLFADARVRRALTHAIDRAAIVEGIYHGYAVPGRTTVTPAHWSFDAQDPVTTLAHDPEAARRLLDEAGWTLSAAGSGIRTNAAGEPLRFTLLCDNVTAPCDVAQVIQADIQRVGVDMRIRQEEFSTRQERAMRPAADAPGRDFEALIGNFLDPIGKTDEHLLGSQSQENPYAWTGYSSPVLDSLMEALDRMPAREEASALWRRYQMELAQAAPYTVLYYPQSLVAVGRRLQGVEPNAWGEVLAGSTRWWIPPAMRR